MKKVLRVVRWGVKFSSDPPASWFATLTEKAGRFWRTFSYSQFRQQPDGLNSARPELVGHLGVVAAILLFIY
jgi:hypothetical protein